MTTNKLNYSTKKVILDKAKMESLFVFQDNKRKIRSSQVKNLMNALEEGNTFPRLSVNATSPSNPNKWLLVDGNHRHEALLKFFEKHPTRKVEVAFDVYEVDTEEDERELFRSLNNSVTPSSDDYLNQYKDDNEFVKKILANVPKTSIYGSTSKPIKMRPLLTAFFDAIKQDWSPSVISGMDLVRRADGHSVSDVRYIKLFLKEYQEWFGELTKKSIWLRTTALNVMFRLWFQNKDTITMEEMQERMRKVISHNVVIRDTAVGGRTATEDFARNIIDVLNRQRKMGRSQYTKFVLTNDELY